MGKTSGNSAAALESYRRLGEVVGDALGNALTLVDALTVVGGGISNAWPLFLPTVVAELNSSYTGPEGNKFHRLSPEVFNLEDQHQLEKFLHGATREITIPGTTQKIQYDPMARLGIGICRLGTSEAIAKGAYAFALNQLRK
jgi:glucokinase